MESGINERCAKRPLAQWTRRLAAGDEQAWAWFHERYYLSLLRYGAHCCGNPSAASEVVQQAYMRIARHAKPFAEESDFWGWLSCLVRCAAVDYGRNVRRRMVLLEKFAHWRALHSEKEASWHPSSNHASALAEDALAKLPVDDAALLRRKYCDGWSTLELSADLGATPKAIEHRLARLRERLREIILSIQ